MVHPVSEKNPLPSHPTFTPMWQEKIPQLRPQKLEELPGVWTDDRGNFPWKDCEKMESRVMIIEETIFFLGVLFQAPQN